MSREPTISGSKLETLFPFHLQLDAQLQVTGYGLSLCKLFSTIKKACPLPSDVQLKTLEGHAIRTLEAKHLETYFQLHGPIENLRLRGTFHQLDDGSFFLAALPWIENSEPWKKVFGLEDAFSPHSTEHQILDLHRSLLSSQKVSEQPLLEKANPPFSENEETLSITPSQLSKITLQKRTEERLHSARRRAEEYSRATNEYLAIVSHEIRTQMNGIIGMLQFVMDTQLDDQQRNSLSLIRVSSESLLKILNDVLDLSKIQSARYRLEQLPFNLRDLTDEVVGIMSILACKKGLGLEVIIDPQLPNQYQGDAARLRQILINLISNAIKFTSIGDIRVSINRSQDSHFLEKGICFKVTDTGKGIPNEQIETIFKPFTQVNLSDNPPNSGTGLGLSITKQLVELMGGNICVKSELDRGSEFLLNIPIKPDQPDNRAGSSTENSGYSIVSILSDLARESMCNRLQTVGVPCKAFEHAGESLKHFRESIESSNPPKYFVICDASFGKLTPSVLEGIIEKARLNDPSFRLIVLANPTCSKHERYWQALTDLTLYTPLTYKASSSIDTQAPARSPRNEPKASISNRPPQDSNLFPTGFRVLLAEDHPINQEHLTLLLNKMGITPELAHNGQEVLTKCQQSSYDVVLMDCQMPILDGFETTRKIRAMQAAEEIQNNPYIIAITAFALQGDREKCLQAGMDDYVTKPIYEEKLRKALETVIQPGKPHTRESVEPPPEQNTLPSDPREAFQRLCSDLNDKAALAVTQSFAKMLPQKEQELQELLDNKDFKNLSRLGHSMKSVSKMNGLNRLSELNYKLEQSAGTTTIKELNLLVSEVIQEMKKAKKTLETLLP
ncbi:MAG: ATP-binding protein [Verrucomicrobiota bacterium]|nr:ATP-binding protein [Verrucomicrobiota bacterium]